MKATNAERRDLICAIRGDVAQLVSATALLHIAVADQLGVPPSDLHCLILVSSGVAATPTELAERMGMTTGAVSHMLDRMEQQRLVWRDRNPEDRRGVVVRAHTERLTEFSALCEPMSRHFDEQIGELTTARLRFLAQFVRTARRLAFVEAAVLRRNGRRHGTNRLVSAPSSADTGAYRNASY